MIIKPKEHCKWDLVALGEVMLRFDPGAGRISTARRFDVYEGGGEYNTSRGLRKCFGYKTAVCTAFVDNEVGHLIEAFIMQGGVDTDFILWRPDDGIGRSIRLESRTGRSRCARTGQSGISSGQVRRDEIPDAEGRRPG